MGRTGWSRAWIIDLWDRLEDGDQAYENVLALLRKSTLPNLFDTHPPIEERIATLEKIASVQQT